MTQCTCLTLAPALDLAPPLNMEMDTKMAATMKMWTLRLRYDWPHIMLAFELGGGDARDC